MGPAILNAACLQSVLMSGRSYFLDFFGGYSLCLFCQLSLAWFLRTYSPSNPSPVSIRTWAAWTVCGSHGYHGQHVATCGQCLGRCGQRGLWMCGGTQEAWWAAWPPAWAVQLGIRCVHKAAWGHPGDSTSSRGRTCLERGTAGEAGGGGTPWGPMCVCTHYSTVVKVKVHFDFSPLSISLN